MPVSQPQSFGPERRDVDQLSLAIAVMKSGLDDYLHPIGLTDQDLADAREEALYAIADGFFRYLLLTLPQDGIRVDTFSIELHTLGIPSELHFAVIDAALVKMQLHVAVLYREAGRLPRLEHDVWLVNDEIRQAVDGVTGG